MRFIFVNLFGEYIKTIPAGYITFPPRVNELVAIEGKSYVVIKVLYDYDLMNIQISLSQNSETKV